MPDAAVVAGIGQALAQIAVTAQVRAVDEAVVLMCNRVRNMKRKDAGDRDYQAHAGCGGQGRLANVFG